MTNYKQVQTYLSDDEKIDLIDNSINKAFDLLINKHGDKIWEKFGSFTFPGEEDDTDVPSTASEYVFITNEGNIVSVIDLSFGVGLEILKKE